MDRKKLFFAGAIGNSIEVFEAVIYAFLQPFITKTFFPTNLRENNLLFFLTIILPFLARPLGGLIFGVIGDLKGRKAVLELSMIISGISCAAMALVPSFQEVGLISFILILSFRFLFGLAMSGEYNNSFLYLAEHAVPESRGYILSWAAFGVSFGNFLATFFAYTVTQLIDNNLLPFWSFRLLFLLSTLTLYMAYLVRKNLSETADFFISYPSFEENKLKAIYKNTKNEIWQRLLPSLKIVLLSGFGTHITYSLIIYGPFHITKYNINNITFNDAMLLITITSLVSAIMIPNVGKLTDIIGRRFLITVSIIVLTIQYLFFFFKIAPNGTYQELLYFYLLLGLSGSVYFCVAPAEIIASLPKQMRSTVNGLLYGIPAILFGAFSLPYFQTLFQKYPKSPCVIFMITAPLIIYFIFTTQRWFKPRHHYWYALEKTKVS